MAERRLSHLVQRGQVFYFRRALPHRLVAILGKHEIKCSLGTADIAVARIRCRVLSSRFEQITARTGDGTDMTQDEIRALAQTYFAEQWSRSRELALLAPSDAALDIEAEVQSLRDDGARLRQWTQMGKFDPVRNEAKRLIAQSNKANSPDDLAQLCIALMRANIEDRRILAALLSGQYEDAEPRDPLFKGMSEPELPPLPGENPSANSGSTLVELAKKFCEQKSASEWVDKTYNENRRVLDWFIQCVGGTKPIKNVTLEDVREYRDTILKLPANSIKSKKFAGMSVKQIAAAATAGGMPTLAPKTQQKYFFNIKGFLGWCVDEGYLSAHPASQLKINVKVNEKEARYPFSADQLVKLFKSPQYCGHLDHKKRSLPGSMVTRDGKFWIPIIGLFSGMRLGEIVQLLVTDILEEGQVVYFNVARGEGEEKQLKTASSVRVVPVHPQLIKMGFLPFVEAKRKKSPKGRIFDDIKPGSDGYYSHQISKYFSRYLTQIEAKTPKTSFHSFRHSFTDALRTAHIQDSRVKALLGHADNSVTAGYGSKYTASDLAPDIAAVNYGLDLTHLYE